MVNGFILYMVCYDIGDDGFQVREDIVRRKALPQDKQDGIVAGQGSHDGDAGPTVDAGRDGRGEAGLGLDDGVLTGELDAQDAVGLRRKPCFLLRQPIPLTGGFHHLKGLQVAGQGGLGGFNALQMQLFLQLFLAEDGIMFQNFQQCFSSESGFLHKIA